MSIGADSAFTSRAIVGGSRRLIRSKQSRPPDSCSNAVAGVRYFTDRRSAVRRPVLKIGPAPAGIISSTDFHHRVECFAAARFDIGRHGHLIPPKRFLTDGHTDPRRAHLRRKDRRREELPRKPVGWAATESTWNFAAKPRNVLFYAMVKSITIFWEGRAASTVILDECWLRRSRRRSVLVRIP